MDIELIAAIFMLTLVLVNYLYQLASTFVYRPPNWSFLDGRVALGKV